MTVPVIGTGPSATIALSAGAVIATSGRRRRQRAGRAFDGEVVDELERRVVDLELGRTAFADVSVTSKCAVKTSAGTGFGPSCPSTVPFAAKSRSVPCPVPPV